MFYEEWTVTEGTLDEERSEIRGTPGPQTTPPP